MSLYGDPAHLYRLARRLDDRAAEVDGRAADLRRWSGQSTWQSVAAEVHRHRVGEAAHDLDRCAAGLRETADALRRHAAACEARLAQIRDAERAVRHWFAAAEHSVASALSDAGHALVDGLGGLVHTVTRPWDGWHWRPDNLPVPGSLEWLAVHELTRSSGWRP